MPSWSSLNEEEPEEGQWFEGMSWTTRIQGFLIFAVLGLFASVMSWAALGMGSYWKYAVLMSLGNVMSVCATVLLMGPQRQLKMMFDPVRRTATMVYIGLLVGTIVAAFTWHSAVLCASLCFAQYLALIWYSLSYIPYGRDMALGCLKGCTRLVVAV